MLHLETIEPKTLDLLNKILKIDIFSECRLVGGTSLALQLGHRKSVDLDFFGKIVSDPLEIQEQLKQIAQIKIIQESKFIFQYILNDVKVDFVNYPYKWLEDVVSASNIRLADKKDIAAMKLSAVTNRGTKKDFIDIFELLNYFTLEQMLNFYEQKYDEAISFSTVKSLTYFDDAEEEPMPYMLNGIKWEDVKLRILTEIHRLAGM